MTGSDGPLTLDTAAVERRTSSLWIRAELASTWSRDALDLAAPLQTGSDAFSELAAARALHVNGYQSQNLAILPGNSVDPMSILGPVVRTSNNPDAFQLEMTRRWIRRDQTPRAARAAPFFEHSGLRFEAEKLLRAAP